MEIHIRKAAPADIERIMAVLEQARAFLKQQGFPQWQNGTGPNEAKVREDIRRQAGYVLACDGVVRAYAALLPCPEESYDGIYDGAWDTRYGAYAVIHRVAADGSIRGHGLSKRLICALLDAAAELGHHDIRIDTYPLNKIMESVILGTGFTYRGMIKLPFPNGERKAYQLLLNP